MCYSACVLDWLNEPTHFCFHDLTLVDVGAAVKDFTPLKRLFQLESLRIQGLGPSTSISLTDTAVEQISANCTALQTLELVSHTKLTNAALIAIGHNCHNLSTFKLHPCASGPIDSQGVAALASLTNLQTLQLTNLSSEIDPAFQPLSQQCTGLTSLCVTDCSRFSRWALRRLAFHCGKLKKLDVSRCKKLAMYEALVDVKLCTNLEVSRVQISAGLSGDAWSYAVPPALNNV